MVDGRCGTDGPGCCGRIIRADNQVDVLFAGKIQNFVLYLEAIANDEKVNAVFDGFPLDFLAVSDDYDELFWKDLFPIGETIKGGQIHGSDFDIEVGRFVFSLRLMKNSRFEGGGDRLQIGVDALHGPWLKQLWNKEFSELKNGDKAVESIDGIRNRKDSHVVVFNQFKNLGAGGVAAGFYKVGDHNVANARSDISQKKWERCIESVKDRIDPRVGISATGCHAFGLADEVFEIGVSDCGTD